MVEKFVEDNISGFTANKVAVQISSGPTYQPITLFVNEFQPVDEHFLALSQIKRDSDGNFSSEFTRQYAPPFALLPNANSVLREKCLEHVKLIAKQPRCRGEVHYKHTSIVSWDVFSAIAQYQRSSNVGLFTFIIPKNLLNHSGTESICRRSNLALCHALLYGANSCFYRGLRRCGD
jgi:hypothetical protein